MNIGVDLDGVVYDSENWFQAFAEVYDLKHNGKGVLVSYEIDIQKRYGWSEEFSKDFREKYLPIQMEESPIMPYVKEVLDMLKKDGHKIFIITSRGSVNPSHKDITLKRLEKDKIPYDEIYFSKVSKVETCKLKQIDIMIDDNFNVVKELLQNGIKCLYFKSVMSKNLNEDAIEVHNWGEIYSYITKYKKIKNV